MHGPPCVFVRVQLRCMCKCKCKYKCICACCIYHTVAFSAPYVMMSEVFSVPNLPPTSSQEEFESLLYFQISRQLPLKNSRNFLISKSPANLLQKVSEVVSVPNLLSTESTLRTANLAFQYCLQIPVCMFNINLIRFLPMQRRQDLRIHACECKWNVDCLDVLSPFAET